MPLVASSTFLWLIAIMSDRNPQAQDKFVVRFPDGLRDRIKMAAAENSRSMNAEIIHTLEEKYPAPAPPEMLTEVAAFLDTLPERFDQIKDPEFKREFMREFLSIMVEYGDPTSENIVDMLMAQFDPDRPFLETGAPQKDEYNVDADGSYRPGVRKVELDD